MTQRQINSLNMFNAVLQYMNDNHAQWIANTLITTGVENFSASLNGIRAQAAGQQNSSTRGYTAKKDQEMANMVNLCYKLALRVKNYAMSINDPVLKQAVDFSRHALQNGKETIAVNRCLVIIEKANSIVSTAPVEFKITPGLIEQATAATQAIVPATAERDVAGGMRSSTTTQLANLFKTARTYLQTLDGLVEADVEDNNAAFAHNYFIMRRTTDRRRSGNSNATEEEEKKATPAV